jgi:hypothetical protein
MGYSSFPVGERVRITRGNFVGIEGKVVSPLEPAQAGGTIILHGPGKSYPVTIVTLLDGRAVSLRVPPELLERVA